MHDQNRWDTWLEPAWIDKLDGTPFLSRCREGKVSREELTRFLVQQYFYSKNFTRYLCALLSNLENESYRQKLTENLVDETGLGVQKGEPHSKIYRRMLERMGVNPADYPMHAATRALIEVMWHSCRNPNSAVGLGALCLGAEAIVPHVYSQVVDGFRSHGEKDESLEFFHLHIGCDDEHALTMKQIIEEMVVEPEQKEALRCSAARAIAARARFLEALA